ncbi:hypothetical protein CY35_05G147700 [Sphagnum magellanicum]|nr:hypothetical protein CY35_05G147700 [Sphagnum magellanicum]KAH9563883.1 hypothetical protein CY35_05G147700 [Sphagnum magellanicum]KAH9563884.1 hypothetical protein CY35_05G147700 [Sphagnum magellanicum]
MLNVILVTGVTNQLTCANKGMRCLWELARVYLWKGASSPQSMNLIPGELTVRPYISMKVSQVLLRSASQQCPTICLFFSRAELRRGWHAHVQEGYGKYCCGSFKSGF